MHYTKNFSLERSFIKTYISIPYSQFTRIFGPNDKNEIISLDGFAFGFWFYATE